MTKHPCLDNDLISKTKIKPVCDFIAEITNNRINYLKIMRYTRQNPARVEDEGEYEAVFKNAKKTFINNGYYHSKATVTKILKK